jgi:hypothetical protein
MVGKAQEELQKGVGSSCRLLGDGHVQLGPGVSCRVVDDILLEDLETSQVKRLDLLDEEIRLDLRYHHPRRRQGTWHRYHLY